MDTSDICNRELFLLFLAIDDFVSLFSASAIEFTSSQTGFKNIMVKRNLELEAEALQAIEKSLVCAFAYRARNLDALLCFVRFHS